MKLKSPSSAASISSLPLVHLSSEKRPGNSLEAAETENNRKVANRSPKGVSEGRPAAMATGAEEAEQVVVSVSAGASHTVALLSSDRLCAWGRGEDGQLGLGSADEKLTPAEVVALRGRRLSSVACGADHTTAFSDAEKTVWSWGWGDFGRLGLGHSTDVFLPQPVRSLSNRGIRQIACGDCHCIAITAEGELFSWGRNQNGQLGIGTTEDALVPTEITALKGTPMAMVAAGAEHTAAVSQDGGLYGWGWGRYGNLGLGDRADRHVPEKVTSVEGEKMAKVACGWRHTITVNEAGKLFTFGWSKYGQLGHGDNRDHLTPSPVASMAEKTILQVSGGWRHSVALDSEGTVFAWGWNKFGQVGNGTNEDQNAPQRVTTISEKVTQVSCGWRHTVCLTEGSNVYAWGRATSGQLGVGDTEDRNTPTLVVAISKDGDACRNISAPPSAMVLLEDAGAAQGWVAPAERYAVVPGEKPPTQSDEDASVPDTDMKRLRLVTGTG